jgi:hypothetical protein
LLFEGIQTEPPAAKGRLEGMKPNIRCTAAVAWPTGVVGGGDWGCRGIPGDGSSTGPGTSADGSRLMPPISGRGDLHDDACLVVTAAVSFPRSQGHTVTPTVHKGLRDSRRRQFRKERIPRGIKWGTRRSVVNPAGSVQPFIQPGRTPGTVQRPLDTDDRNQQQQTSDGPQLSTGPFEDRHHGEPPEGGQPEHPAERYRNCRRNCSSRYG